MTGSDLVNTLKQGRTIWNTWRKQNPTEQQINLIGADLRGANLHEADLSNVNLMYANLDSANLSFAMLSGANLIRSKLSHVNLEKAVLLATKLSYANLDYADLLGAKLSHANLRFADLRFADLSDVDLNHANLDSANLSYANLSNVNFAESTAFRTIFSGVDLREAKGLAEIHHSGASVVSIHTVNLPQDGSALHFLRGAGCSDEWIDFYRAQMMSPIQYHSCFISYAGQDDALARRLHADLQDQGVRCWFAQKDMKTGDKIRARIDEMIHRQDKLLLLLSEHALKSSWVEIEVEAALEKEKNQQREVLFPIRLDESVMQASQAWAKQMRRARHISDFTRWTDPQAYQTAFDRLLRDLKRMDEHTS